MKRTLCLIMVMLFTVFTAACATTKHEETKDDKTVLSFVTPAGPPREKYYYLYRWIAEGANTTNFYIPPTDKMGREAQRVDELALTEASEPVDCTVQNTSSGRKYIIEGTVYYPVENLHAYADASIEEYIWLVDRRFFYKYADTKGGAVLYRSINCNSDEVIIYDDGTTENDEDLILARWDSKLLDLSKYTINDFGIAVINYHTFCDAGLIERLFEVHTGNADAKQIDEEYFFANYDCCYDICLEYTRIPGLRYSFEVIGSDNNQLFVYSRSKEAIMCVENTFGSPFKE